MRTTSIPPLNRRDVIRFWSKVHKPIVCGPNDRCWEWIGGKNPDGYGLFWLKSRNFHAHRIIFKLEHGGRLKGYVIMHKCDNPSCVRPDHLIRGTLVDNNRDMVRKGRQAKGERHGSRTCPEKLIRGESHKCSKLTPQKVRNLRRKYYLGKNSQNELARFYGISQAAVSKIVRLESWRHI